ncbi:DUF418 domain-containing protein [Corynebacterium urealyticum]|uniref:Uncharacterized protein n=1 Tax=Corynebacterium urealyticum (strain ATCC 43042 / DSM 7109) TaxID=504474 RepID=B1VFR5_CORU7|nr:DUF418 domain-containing protein [Corynebacterium urealyticum]AGE36227.1 hypothetical protein CU7111_0633 [Corynebacterium urealyticum DSM 7111]QQB07898.1 DUF418 domain-containing protein [Corynebacterium urealyticum]QQC41913.1 DUF418 domain-containing protein [Corynebacterium urealyticum]QQE50537.1 DUF418 domain-containing protein [Corynebacterium urealyticum]CAQ04604.1 hypothetical protein cu0644 [Corynebacterium urealyticum DSM 7109]
MQNRNVGIDVARAVALGGMMVAHLTYLDGVAVQVFYGFPAALFAFISGVSMGYMRARPAQLIVRGLCLIALHFALAPFTGQVFVVLGTIGLCMALLAWAPRWSSPVLLWLACVLTFGSAVLASTATVLIPAFWPYSPLTWGALMIAGMLFRRHMLSPKLLWLGLVVGLGLFAGDLALRWYTMLPEFFDVGGHTGGLGDIIGSIGASVGICSLCCLLQRWIGWLAPLGRMPLTIYCIHVLTADRLAPEWFGFWISLGGAILISYAWLAVCDRGPLETLLRRITAVFGKDKNEEVRS